MFSPEVSLRLEAAKIVATSWGAMTMGKTSDGTPAPKTRRQLYLAIEDMVRYLETGQGVQAPANKAAA